MSRWRQNTIAAKRLTVLGSEFEHFSALFFDPLNVKVLYKLKKGLESENADMNRDVESEYREILK